MATDKEVDHALERAAVGGTRITLQKIGMIEGMDLYVDVAGKPRPQEAYELAVAVLFKAFIGGKK